MSVKLCHVATDPLVSCTVARIISLEDSMAIILHMRKVNFPNRLVVAVYLYIKITAPFLQGFVAGLEKLGRMTIFLTRVNYGSGF